jgi:hypothetical protein
MKNVKKHLSIKGADKNKLSKKEKHIQLMCSVGYLIFFA